MVARFVKRVGARLRSLFIDEISSGKDAARLETWEDNKPLPKAQEAEIDLAKFEKYSMDPNNPNNEGKWEAFDAIGYNVHSEAGRSIGARDVIAQLLEQLPITPASAGKPSPFGSRFEVAVDIRGPNAKIGTLITIGQIDVDSAAPRLVSNWLKVHR